jgi:hypothetical protein
VKLFVNQKITHAVLFVNSLFALFSHFLYQHYAFLVNFEQKLIN